MGIESVVYRLNPSACTVDDLTAFLLPRMSTRSDSPHTFVLADDEHWIDVKAWVTGREVESIDIRVAVTNPVSVVPMVDGLASALLQRFGGTLRAPARHRSLTDAERRAVLLEDFTVGRRRFTEFYGHLLLPVSADEVFERLREIEGRRSGPDR